MEENETMIMLYDYFGELLTCKQREYFDMYYNEDFSLSEIAECGGVTRQSVYDTISRAVKTLTTFEEKTGVAERFKRLRLRLDNAHGLAEILSQSLCGGEYEEQAKMLARELDKIKLGLLSDI